MLPATTVSRTHLIVMVGFGLPTDPAHVCLVLFTMGAVGLLPLGVGTGPASMVAALAGTASIASATAAGLVVSAATVLAVLIYAAVVWAWRTVLPRAGVPRPAAL